MRIEEMIAAIQAQLGLDVDGKAGPQTWGAIYARIVQKKIDGQPPALATVYALLAAPGGVSAAARWLAGHTA